VWPVAAVATVSNAALERRADDVALCCVQLTYGDGEGGEGQRQQHEQAPHHEQAHSAPPAHAMEMQQQPSSFPGAVAPAQELAYSPPPGSPPQPQNPPHKEGEGGRGAGRGRGRGSDGDGDTAPEIEQDPLRQSQAAAMSPMGAMGSGEQAAQQEEQVHVQLPHERPSLHLLLERPDAAATIAEVAVARLRRWLPTSTLHATDALCAEQEERRGRF
jgi:hypothetical protein